MSLYAFLPKWIQETLDCLKTQKMCPEAESKDSWCLEFFLSYLKTTRYVPKQ